MLKIVIFPGSKEFVPVFFLFRMIEIVSVAADQNDFPLQIEMSLGLDDAEEILCKNIRNKQTIPAFRPKQRHHKTNDRNTFGPLVRDFSRCEGDLTLRQALRDKSGCDGDNASIHRDDGAPENHPSAWQCIETSSGFR